MEEVEPERRVTERSESRCDQLGSRTPTVRNIRNNRNIGEHVNIRRSQGEVLTVRSEPHLGSDKTLTGN